MPAEHVAYRSNSAGFGGLASLPAPSTRNRLSRHPSRFRDSFCHCPAPQPDCCPAMTQEKRKVVAEGGENTSFSFPSRFFCRAIPNDRHIFQELSNSTRSLSLSCFVPGGCWLLDSDPTTTAFTPRYKMLSTENDKISMPKKYVVYTYEKYAPRRTLLVLDWQKQHLLCW